MKTGKGKKCCGSFSPIKTAPSYHPPNCSIYAKLQKTTSPPKLQSTFNWQQHGQGTTLAWLSGDETFLWQLIKPESQGPA